MTDAITLMWIYNKVKSLKLLFCGELLVMDIKASGIANLDYKFFAVIAVQCLADADVTD